MAKRLKKYKNPRDTAGIAGGGEGAVEGSVDWNSELEGVYGIVRG